MTYSRTTIIYRILKFLRPVTNKLSSHHISEMVKFRYYVVETFLLCKPQFYSQSNLAVTNDFFHVIKLAWMYPEKSLFRGKHEKFHCQTSFLKHHYHFVLKTKEQNVDKSFLNRSIYRIWTLLLYQKYFFLSM